MLVPYAGWRFHFIGSGRFFSFACNKKCSMIQNQAKIQTVYSENIVPHAGDLTGLAVAIQRA